MKRKKTLSQFKINQLNINGLCSVAKQRELQARLKSSKSEIVIISDAQHKPEEQHRRIHPILSTVRDLLQRGHNSNKKTLSYQNKGSPYR